MKITEYQMKELQEARELQKKCVDMHLPSPAVISWEAVISEDGKDIEKIRSKANSYVRNALNILAYHVGCCSSSIVQQTPYADGFINVVNVNGNASSITDARRGNNPALILRSQSVVQPESLDTYSMGVNEGTWQSSAVSIFSYMNGRSLITEIMRSYTNNGQSATIQSSGIEVPMPNGINMLLIRDVFNPVPVGAGQTITFKYITEVLYPI